jgi:choline monooxygenase
VSERLFDIDPDIRVAATLPARVYSDPGLFRLQQERTFARTWQYAGHHDLVGVAGQVFPFTLIPGVLDEPLVLIRDGEDRLHCLSLRCRYHGRRFTLGVHHFHRLLAEFMRG